jgi:predicted transcriptional regulator
MTKKLDTKLKFDMWCDTLVYMIRNILDEDITAKKLRQHLNTEPSHFVTIAKFLEFNGLIIKNKIGKKNKFVLTDKGKRLAKLLDGLYEEVKGYGS